MDRKSTEKKAEITALKYAIEVFEELAKGRSVEAEDVEDAKLISDVLSIIVERINKTK